MVTMRRVSSGKIRYTECISQKVKVKSNIGDFTLPIFIVNQGLKAYLCTLLIIALSWQSTYNELNNIKYIYFIDIISCSNKL